MSVNLYNATTGTLKNVAGDIVNPQSVNNTIAPTEETTTASRAYNVDEQFFLNGTLYKATANIAQGDTITIGINCTTSDKLSEQIDNLNNDFREALNEGRAEIDDIHNVYNSKNIFPYDPTVITYPYSGYGITVSRSEDGVFTINGTATQGRFLYLTSRRNNWRKNDLVGMKLSIQSTKANALFVTIGYFETVSSESHIKYVSLKNNDQDYIIEDYPYILIGFEFTQTTFNNDTLAIMLRSAHTVNREYAPIIKTNKQLEETKQDVTDNNLQTNSKQIVGAINEVKSDLPNNLEISNQILSLKHDNEVISSVPLPSSSAVKNRKGGTVNFNVSTSQSVSLGFTPNTSKTLVVHTDEITNGSSGWVTVYYSISGSTLTFTTSGYGVGNVQYQVIEFN